MTGDDGIGPGRGTMLGPYSIVTGAVPMSMSLPVSALVFLGVLIAVLGLFAAGNIVITIVGLVAVFGAGVLQIAGARRGV